LNFDVAEIGVKGDHGKYLLHVFYLKVRF
jgi:hypothetical protein